MPTVSPVSVQLVLELTQATVLAPTVLPAEYVVPSTGVSATAAVRRKTRTLSKSASAGLDQLSATSPVPAVQAAALTLAGERLSMLTVVPAVSEPACENVLVQESIFAVTE